MKNKKLCGLVSLLLATGLLAGCGEQPAPEPTTSETPTQTTSSEPEAKMYTVRFLVDGVVVKTIQVEEGKKADFGGEPTKAADAEAPKYRFTGWDKDINLPITADTDFNASFEGYAFEHVIDDFESYASASKAVEAGWKSEAYKSDAWTTETNAKIGLGHYSATGKQALQYNVWRNNIGFRASKTFEAGSFTKPANAFQFALKATAEFYEVNAIFYVPAEVEGVMKDVPFIYNVAVQTTKPITTNEYVTYTVPFSYDQWSVYGSRGTVYSFADYYGVDGDDVPMYAVGVAFTFKGSDASTSETFVDVDDIKFVTVDSEEVETVERTAEYTTYTATIAGGLIVRLDITGQDGSATATVSNDPTHPIAGKITKSGKEVTFTSSDEGATLVYKGQLTNGNKKIKYVEATGSLATYINSADMDAVQVVDNFEQYTSSGTAYYKDSPKENRSGLRGAYYQEYLNGSLTTTSPWGSSTSSLMGGNGDQVNLVETGGIDNSKYATFKYTKDNGMRYLTWSLFEGGETKTFNGTTFSFWVKTDGKCKPMINVYYQSAPVFSTRNNYMKTQTYTLDSAVSEWTRQQITIPAGQTVFGFMLYNWNSYSTGNGIVMVDNIEVFTANPYF